MLALHMRLAFWNMFLDICKSQLGLVHHCVRESIFKCYEVDKYLSRLNV